MALLVALVALLVARNTAHRHYRALLRSERQRERAIRARALDLEATLADFADSAGSPDLADLASSHLADLAGGAGFSQEELMALVAGMLSAGEAEEKGGVKGNAVVKRDSSFFYDGRLTSSISRRTTHCPM